MKNPGLKILPAIFLVLFFSTAAWALSPDEEAWVILERNRPQEALAKSLNQDDFLFRWVVAVAEMRTGAAASRHDETSQAARAFEDGDFEGAARILEPMLASSADILQSRLHLGACLVELGRIPEAENMLTRAIDQARSEKRLASQCYGLLTRGRARARLRQVEPPREDLLETIDLCRRLETHSWAGMAAIALSVVSRQQMDLEDALSWREVALEYYRHAGDLKGQARALRYIAAISVMNGELTLAMTELEDAVELARRADAPDELGGILGEMAAINYLLGDCDKALDQYREALRLAPNPWRHGIVWD